MATHRPYRYTTETDAAYEARTGVVATLYRYTTETDEAYEARTNS